MKLNEVIAKYGNQEVEESKIKEVLGVQESKVWKPKDESCVYVIKASGEIAKETYANFNSYAKKSYQLGNVFETEEEAEFARDKRIFLTKFERYLRENEDDPVDWDNTKQCKWSIKLLHDEKAIRTISWYGVCYQGTICTTSQEVLQAFIKENETDIKKYMFGVE